ncbi:MAG: hypothetical protein IIB06_05650 [Bacteroidetes bacterium]|nr:hypothetical protein [Bacteroidota bacterium]
MKKFLVLGILFLLPITAYIFFASGVNNFGRLPILTHSVSEIYQFKTLNGSQIVLQDRITVLGFFGKDVRSSHANAFNLGHKIYKKNYKFDDFQFVILMPEGTEDDVKLLKIKLAEIEDPQNWNFVYGADEAIQNVFNSLQTNYSLDANLSTPYVFIIDKDRNLRGRDDDEDEGILYGFDARNYSEINNKMGDDIKVILAEYRLALKKYNSKREI